MTHLTLGGEYDLFVEGGHVNLAVWESDAVDAGDCSGVRLTPSEAAEMSRKLRSILTQTEEESV